VLISRFASVTAALLSLLASSALSQDRSAEEMIGLFEQQQVSSGLTRSALGTEKVLHRGLVVAPSTGGQDAELEEIEFEAVKPDTEVTVRILFDLNSSMLRADQEDKLSSVCEAMLAMGGTLFRIIGHTDASGTESHNDRLSVWRAEAIRSHLINVCGVGESRLQAVGVGERYLRDTDRPVSEVNRRVEFQAVGDVGS